MRNSELLFRQLLADFVLLRCRSEFCGGLVRRLFCRGVLRSAGKLSAAVASSERGEVDTRVAWDRRVSQTGLMSELRHSESIVIARSPEDLYGMVSDVTRMGDGVLFAGCVGEMRGPARALGLGSPGAMSSRSGPGRPVRRSWWPTQATSLLSSLAASSPAGVTRLFRSRAVLR